VAYAAVVLALLTKLSTDRTVKVFVNQDEHEIHEKLLADIKEGHRRHINMLKKDHAKAVLYLDTSLDKINFKYSQLHYEHDFISSLYQDQVRLNGEQEDRINYLEKKLQEFGQSTPITRAPFSAPPSKVTFSDPPRRQPPSSSSQSFGLNPMTHATMHEISETPEE
jgi:hypothetical protein